MTQQHTQNPSGNSGPTVPVGRVVVCCLAILSVAGAVLHYAVASENFQAHWSFGVLMLVAAWLQVMWAVAVIVRTSPPVLWAGAVFNAGVAGGGGCRASGRGRRRERALRGPGSGSGRRVRLAAGSKGGSPGPAASAW